MNARNNHEIVAKITRRGLVLAALLAMVLSAAGIAPAQSTAASTSSPAAKPAVAAGPSAVSPAAKSPAKGSQEGIKIHGHWTIEVRNPDGSLDKRVEFENGICPSQQVTGGGGILTTTTTFAGGALALSMLATGQASAGPWEIILGSSAALNPTTNVPPGCSLPPSSNQVIFTNSVTLLQNNAATVLLNYCSAAPACFAMLSPPAAPSSGTPTISLGGQFTATTSGSVSLVSTANVMCTDNTVSPAGCLAYSTFNPAILTGTQLTGTGGVPGPQPYAAGQIVSASVVISFQ